MMKTDYRIDYISLTAAHFTTFPQTPQSEKILQANYSDQADRAQSVKSAIGNRSREKAVAQVTEGGFSAYV